MSATALKSRASARKLCLKHGREVTLIKKSSFLVDEARPDGPSTNADKKIKQFVIDTGDKLEQVDDDKTFIMVRNYITYYDVSNGDISNFDIVDDENESKEFKIHQINKIKPGSEIVAYEIKVIV